MSFSIRVGKVGVDVGPHVIYCGRPGNGEVGQFGNQFAIGRDGTRDEVIARHRVWFNAPEQHELRGELLRAAERKIRNGHATIVLACFCSPRSCHCDTMVQWLRNVIEE